MKNQKKAEHPIPSQCDHYSESLGLTILQFSSLFPGADLDALTFQRYL